MRRLALALAGVALGVLVAEGVVRFAGVRPYPEWSPRNLHEADPELGLVPAPGFSGRQESSEYSIAIRTNSLGLRSDELPTDPGFVVFVIGDSFAFGHGVEQDETTPARLQAIQPSFTVLNLGVMSYGTRQSVRRFERVAAKIRPDLVVLLFYAGNDVLDDVRPPLSVRDGFVVGRDEELPSWRRVQLWLKFHSAAYRVIADALHRPEVPGRCSDHTSFGFDLFRKVPTEAVVRGWESTRGDLVELRDTASAMECRIAVACIPARFQVEDERWRRHREECGFEEGDFDLGLVQRRLGSMCEELAIPFLDLAPALRAAESPAYFQGELEMHLTVEGHRRVAEALAEFLSR